MSKCILVILIGKYFQILSLQFLNDSRTHANKF